MNVQNRRDHISVCICTYKRPAYLARLLVHLMHLRTDNLFDYSAVIVDNDSECTGKPVVEAFCRSHNLEILYLHEKIQNISLARNKSVKNAQGNLIAFIDDDEFPDKNWLFNLYKAYMNLGVDGVLGPVKPHFEEEPPKWIKQGRICERKSFTTGTRLVKKSDTRTGNALLSQELFQSDEPFDPDFGRTGGGDSEFFRRQMIRGRRFMWCNEAVVYETVLKDRLTREYYLKRAFTRGLATARAVPAKSFATLKSLSAIILYTSFLPIAAVSNDGLFMKFLIKECDHLSKLLSYIGIDFIKARPY